MMSEVVLVEMEKWEREEVNISLPMQIRSQF